MMNPCSISQKNIGSCRAGLFSSLRDAIISTVSLDTLPPTGVKLSLYSCAGSVYGKPYTPLQHVTHSIQFSLSVWLWIIDYYTDFHSDIVFLFVVLC